MDNIDKKLNSKNPATISQIFSRLVENVSSDSNIKLQFSYLKAKSLCENSLVCDGARLAIFELIQRNRLQLDYVLTEFVTSVSTTSNAAALTKIIASLMSLRLGENSNKALVQHPLVKIIQSEAGYEVQMLIFNEIQQAYLDNDSQMISLHALYKPLYLYCLCSPLVNLNFGCLKQKLWNFLVQHEVSGQQSFLMSIMCLMQLQSIQVLETINFVDEVLRSSEASDVKYVALLQLQVIYNMVLANSNSQFAIQTLLDHITDNSFSYPNLSLLLLSKCVPVSSPAYLEALLKLCLQFASEKTLRSYSFMALKAVLLQWLASPCLLTEKALKTVEDLLMLQDYVFRDRPKVLIRRLTVEHFHYSTFCNPELFLALHLGIKTECVEESNLVESFKDAPKHFVKNCFPFLCGMLLNPRTLVNIKIDLLRILVDCSLIYIAECLPIMLTVILHALSSSEDSKLQFNLLKALPKMAKCKENLPKVVATLQGISKGSPSLRSFALKLLYNTWEVDAACYNALENVAMTSLNNPSRQECIARAFIYKKLAEKRPELYGKDLVAHLSKILNESTTLDGAMPTALALDGIRHLCRAEVIDIVTTWATLSPKFKHDNRLPVIKSLCKLLSEIPNLEYTQSYEKLNEEAVQQLWSYVTQCEDQEGVEAALDALVPFGLELISAYIPEQYLDEGMTPGNRVVPGKVWIKFLDIFKIKSLAKSFVSKLIEVEVSNYLKFVYQLKYQKEPENYSNLPSHSLVKALGEYLKRHFIKVKESPDIFELYLSCLQILSLKYSKPLPPLDWCFLHEIVHIPELTRLCLDLASRQAVLSGSARRLMENYIEAQTETATHKAAIHVYRNMKNLANSIQPVVLKPFLQNTLIASHSEHFQEYLGHLSQVLSDADVLDVNKNVIEEILSEMIFIHEEVDSPEFAALLTIVPAFSLKAKEAVCAFTDPKRSFVKVTKIRCTVARHSTCDSPLAWLDGLFNFACKTNVPFDSYVEDVALTLKQRTEHEDSPFWLNELLGQIQVKVADRCETEQVEYFCDILATVIVHFSGLFAIVPKYGLASVKYFLPAAWAFLLNEPKWSICTFQALEWLHHMNVSESVPEIYRHIFGWCLACLRHEEEFAKSSRWMKYLDCKIHTKNTS